MIVQRGVATAGRFQTIEEVQHHLVHRQVVTHLNLRAEELHVTLHATLLDAQGNDVTQVLLRHQDGRRHDRLAEIGDGRDIRQLGRVVDGDGLTGLELEFVDNARRGGDQVQVVLALQALLDDLHVQHAEEAAAETEAQRIGAFRRVLQRRVIEGQLLQRLTEVLEIVGADREQARVDLRLDLLEARQHLHLWGRRQGQGVADRRTMNVLDAGDDEAHFTGLEVSGGGVFRGEYTDAVDQVHLAGGLDQNLVALLHPALAHAHQRHDAQVVVEPGVDDQRLQRRLDLALGRGDGLHQALEHLVHAHAALGAAGHGFAGVDTDDLLDLVLDALRIGLRQVHLVQHRHDLEALLDGGVAVGNRLRFHALAGIDHQQRTFAGRQRATDFIGEVDVTGGVDEVQLIDLAVLRFVVKRDAVGLDGDAALTLQIHGVQDLSLHFTRGETAAELDETVSQGGLAVVNVGNDGKIADMTQVTHRSTLEEGTGKTLAENSRGLYPIPRNHVTSAAAPAVHAKRAPESAPVQPCRKNYSASLKVMKLARP